MDFFFFFSVISFNQSFFFSLSAFSVLCACMGFRLAAFIFFFLDSYSSEMKKKNSTWKIFRLSLCRFFCCLPACRQLDSISLPSASSAYTHTHTSRPAFFSFFLSRLWLHLPVAGRERKKASRFVVASFEIILLLFCAFDNRKKRSCCRSLFPSCVLSAPIFLLILAPLTLVLS